MGTVSINGKTYVGGSINVTPEGVCIDGILVEGMKDYDGKEAGKVVIVIPPNSTCSNFCIDVQNVDAVEIRGNLANLYGNCDTLIVGNNMTSNFALTTKSLEVGNNLTSNATITADSIKVENNLTSGDLNAGTATIDNNCTCNTFSGCTPLVGGKFKIKN